MLLAKTSQGYLSWITSSSLLKVSQAVTIVCWLLAMYVDHRFINNDSINNESSSVLPNPEVPVSMSGAIRSNEPYPQWRQNAKNGSFRDFCTEIVKTEVIC